MGNRTIRMGVPVASRVIMADRTPVTLTSVSCMPVFSRTAPRRTGRASG